MDVCGRRPVHKILISIIISPLLHPRRCAQASDSVVGGRHGLHVGVCGPPGARSPRLKAPQAAEPWACPFLLKL